MRSIDILTHPTVATHPVVMRARDVAPFRVNLTGLSTDSLGAYGLFGGHAGIGFTATVVPDAVKWSASPDPAAAATFGTGLSPTDYSARDGLPVWLHVTALGATVSRPFLIRRLPGAFAALVDQTVTAGTGVRTYAFAAATGAGLTWAYDLVNPPAGVTLAGRTVIIDTDMLPPGPVLYTVRAADQYGRTIDRVGLVTVEEASITPPPAWIIEATTVIASPTVAAPTVSGSSITG